MKHSKMKFLTVFLLLFAMCLTLFAGCESEGADKTAEFYDAVVKSQTCLDVIADDIYLFWHDAIYNDKYNGDIDLAIDSAFLVNGQFIDFLEENEPKIQSLYKELRDSELESEIKAVVLAYSGYYEFVMNVSDSLDSFSANKKTYKRALATALKNLSMEL